MPLSRAPEAIEDLKDDEAQSHVDQHGAGDVERLKRRGRLQQRALERRNAEVVDEDEDSRQDGPRHQRLEFKAGACRSGQVTDYRLCDPEDANQPVRKRVLEQPQPSPQADSKDFISPHQRKVDGNEQREVHAARQGHPQGQKGLQKHGQQDRHGKNGGVNLKDGNRAIGG